MSGLHKDIAAERSILGAVLLDNAAYNQAAEQLTAGDFSLDSHRKIFMRMADLADSQRPIDYIELGTELEKHKELETIGGHAYISGLLDGAVPENIGEHIRIVREASERRRAAKQIERAQRAIANPSIPTSALAEMGSALAQISVGATLAPRCSEDALALRFSRKHGDDLKYVHRWGIWLRWNGKRWIEDSTLHTFDLARTVCREASAECGDSEKSTAVKLASKATSAAVERLAASDRLHATDVEGWDSDPWLVNTPTGTVDLRTGKIREHRREDRLTKITTTGPDGDCPLWLKFLDRITAGDHELQSYLQRMVGYCLTGVTREHALFFLYGTGANGKSVFLSAISELLGDYAKIAPASSFTVTTTEQHPTDLAGLRGARLVTATETEDGARWAESKVKSLTGGDEITARFMRGNFFQFRPEFKLIIAGNHKPGLRSVDEAIRRRLHLVPFTVTVPDSERDPLLSEKLRAEFPGILRWAVEGCLEWQRQGLNPPRAVRDATADYFAAEDAIGRWLEERCTVDSGCWASATSLFSDWKGWCEPNGEREGSMKRFVQQLEARGFKRERTNRAKGFTGIAVKASVVPRVPGSPILGVHARSRGRSI